MNLGQRKRSRERERARFEELTTDLERRLHVRCVKRMCNATIFSVIAESDAHFPIIKNA